MLHILLHHFKSGDPEQFEGPLEEQCVSSLYVIFWERMKPGSCHIPCEDADFTCLAHSSVVATFLIV